MDEIDHVAVRAGVCGTAGGLAGATRALLRGHPLTRSAALSASSMMIVATACFGLERVATVSWRQVYPDSKPNIIMSHALGGLSGGLVLGFLYNGRPSHGALFLTPIMMAAGYGQLLFDELKQERMQELQKR